MLLEVLAATSREGITTGGGGRHPQAFFEGEGHAERNFD